MGTAFNNSAIVKFNEFNMFTSITGLAYEFRLCGSLEEIGLNNITTWSRADMRYDHIGSTHIQYVYLPNWVAPVGNRDLFFNRILRGVRVGKNCTSVGSMQRNTGTVYFIIESEMVVDRATNYTFADYFFVPDAYVDAYKASTAWSSFASKIYPISSFREMFPNEPARMYEEW